MTNRPPIRRIVISVPPRHWFHGIMYGMYQRYREALLELGCSLFEVQIDAFLPDDIGHLSNLVADIRAFKPQLALGLPNGATALNCRTTRGYDGRRRDLFTDILDLPTACIWDHAPLELADQLLAPLPLRPAESTRGAFDRLRHTLAHPRILHCSLDSGQTSLMRELGFLTGDTVVQLTTPALPGFAPSPGMQANAAASEELPVAFVGHVYDKPEYGDAALDAFATELIEEWTRAGAPPLWDIVMQRIAALPADQRDRLALDPDHTFFWRYIHRLIDHHAQTHLRMSYLGAAGVDVACYGDARIGEAGVPKNLVHAKARVGFGPELGAVFLRHAITIDVNTPGFIHGYSFKPPICFSVGGFMLVNRKHDFINAFGELGEAVSYSDGEDLAGKIDLFLTRTEYRREVARELQAQIAKKHTLRLFFEHILEQAGQWIEGNERIRPSSGVYGREAGPRGHVVRELLESVRIGHGWDSVIERCHGADRPIRIRTPSQAWAYAAEIQVPARTWETGRRYLRLRLVVKSGRLGIARCDRNYESLYDEQFVSSTREALDVTVELPSDLAAIVILRNTADGPTCALISEVALYDEEKVTP